MSGDTRAFRDALGCFATGVAVVTAAPDGFEPTGITINSFSSVSLDPPLVLWCLDRRSDTFSVFEAAKHFTVNVLGQAQEEVSRAFSTSGRQGLNGLAVARGGSLPPAIAGAVAIFDCEVHERHDGGDHVILVGRVLDFSATPDADPLVYHRGKYSAISR